MRFKRIFQIGVWAFCLLVAFSVHGSVRDKGYILVINSYTEGAIWSNYVIDSIRKDRSIGENVAVESMNTLLIDDEESMRVKMMSCRSTRNCLKRLSYLEVVLGVCSSKS